MPAEATTPAPATTPPASPLQKAAAILSPPKAVEPAPPAEVKPEAKAEEKPAEKQASESSRFAALAKKEKGLVLKAQDLKAREEKVAALKAEIEAKQKEDADLLLNPEPYLAKRFGEDWYEKLTKLRLGEKAPAPDLQVKAVEEKFEAFERRQEEAQKKALEEQRAAIDAERKRMVEEFNAGVVDFLKTNSAEYELINQEDAHPLVLEVIRQHAEDTAKTGSPKILSNKEAADLVEKHLEQRLEKLAATKKWQARVQAQPKEPEKRPEVQQRTLSNGLTASTPAIAGEGAPKSAFERAMAKLG